MKKEEISLIGQLLTGMKNSVEKLEKAQNLKDIKMLNSVKAEIISFYKQLKQIL